VTAAALVSENKSFAHPASVDTVPTSAGQEDHVSMATHAGTKARRVATNAGAVVGIELLAGCQGVDFHAPLKSSPPLEATRAAVRAAVPYLVADRYLAPELEWAKQAVLEGRLTQAVEGELFA
jgi:histidine ammonia-lyase